MKHEANVKTLLPGTRMMVSPVQLTVPFAIPVPNSWCANPNHLKIEKLEDDLHHFGKLSKKLQEIFLERDAKGTFICLRT